MHLPETPVKCFGSSDSMIMMYLEICLVRNREKWRDIYMGLINIFDESEEKVSRATTRWSIEGATLRLFQA